MSTAAPLAGVIGHPVGHSKSPVLHGHWLKRYAIAGHYVALPVEPGHFETVVKTLPLMGFRGVNVTLPHKQTAIEIADRVTDRAALIGAANTLTFRDGRILADNTDGYGFIESIRQTAPDWDPRSGPALVLGAGGASRAVVSALLDAGVQELRIANRTRARAEALRENFGARVRVMDWAVLDRALDGAMTLVNTTSLGMEGQPPLTIDVTRLPDEALVTDIVYAPLETPVLRAAAAAGLRTVDGLGMLLHQAVPGFEQWFGQRPEVDDALRAAVLAS
ncbi:MAG: shikimate dehydrogenase [Rubricella sp.]